MTKPKGNSLKAMLDRASTMPAADADAAPIENSVSAAAAPARAAKPRRARAATETAGGKPISPARVGTKMIGGHFPPEISTQLRMLAVEEDTTVQALLEEAISDLLTKKAGRKVHR